MDSDYERSNIAVEDVDFSVRTYHLLSDRKIKHINQLTLLTCRELLEWRNLGKRSLNEIREKLALYGLSLKDETVDMDIKKTILHDLPKILKEIKRQIDEMQKELRFFSYKIDQVATHAEKTRKNNQDEA